MGSESESSPDQEYNLFFKRPKVQKVYFSVQFNPYYSIEFKIFERENIRNFSNNRIGYIRFVLPSLTGFAVV